MPLPAARANPGLATAGRWFYRARVIGFLRFVGVVNAAVWLGATVFGIVGVSAAVYSDEMKALLGPNNFPYFSGAIGRVILTPLSTLHWVCAAVAVAHLLAERLYLGRPLRRLTGWLLVGMILWGLAGDLVISPRTARWHQARHAVNATPASREAAAHALRWWHATAQAGNALLLAGLVVYLWRVANPPAETRFVPAVKLRS